MTSTTKSTFVAFLVTLSLSACISERDLEMQMIIECKNGNLEEVKSLSRDLSTLDFRSTKGGTPLVTAILSKRYDVVEFLILNGASLDFETAAGKSPRAVAAASGDRELLQSLGLDEANPST